MAQQVVDPKLGGVEVGNVDEKQAPIAVKKKTPLRDLQNGNNIVPCTSAGNTTKNIQKKGREAAAADGGIKVSGTKRPTTESSPHHHLSSSSNGANGHLVYVRRKSEEIGGKNSDDDETRADDAQPPLKPGLQEEVAQKNRQINELKMPFSSSFVPSTSSVMSFPSGNPRVIKPSNRTVAAESHCHRVSVDQSKMKRGWEERYLELQTYLKKVDQSGREEFVQNLRAVSSADLSKHAVELEQRAIHLSLEEGKELQRVKALNVLGKPPTKTPAVHHPK